MMVSLNIPRAVVVANQLLGDLFYSFFAIHLHGAFSQTSTFGNGDLYREYILDDNFIDCNEFRGYYATGRQDDVRFGTTLSSRVSLDVKVWL
jgi:hypothetical protein